MKIVNMRSGAIGIPGIGTLLPGEGVEVTKDAIAKAHKEVQGFTWMIENKWLQVSGDTKPATPAKPEKE